MEIKQEVCDETVYHDAVDDPLDEEDEIDDDNHVDGGRGEEGESEEKDNDSDQGSPACNESRLGTIRNVCIEDILYMWCGQKVHALNFFLQMWRHFRLLWWFGV
jgi:hypothetical protein